MVKLPTVQPHGAAFIMEGMPPDGVAATTTTLAPPPHAGAVARHGTMAAELPTAPGEAPPLGATAPVAQPDSEVAPLPGVAGTVVQQDLDAAPLRGVAARAPTMELTVVPVAGVAGADFTVDSGDNSICLSQNPLGFAHNHSMP